MSALPPKADIHPRSCNVRFVPIADNHDALFDYLVGARQQRLWDGQAEGFCGH
jgi:hypothetical protein